MEASNRSTYCANCGAELRGKFCTSCGTPATPPPAEPAPVASESTQAPPAETEATPRLVQEVAEPGIFDALEPEDVHGPIQRPRSLTQVVTETFSIMQARMTSFLVAGGIFALVMFLGYLVLGITGFGTFATSGSSGTSRGWLLLGLLVAVAAVLVGGSFSAAAYIEIVLGAEGEGPAALGELLRQAMRRFPRLLLTLFLLSVLWFLFWLASVILLAIAGNISGALAFLVDCLVIFVLIWLTVMFAFVPQAAVVDGAMAIKALTASKDLVSGYWWRTLGHLLSAILIFAIILTFGITLIEPLSAIVSHLHLFGRVLITLVLALLTALLYAFYITYLTLMFFDLKARKGEAAVSLAAAAS